VLIGTLEKQQAFVFGWKQGCFGGEFSVLAMSLAGADCVKTDV
jgi:hypothetical protein